MEHSLSSSVDVILLCSGYRRCVAPQEKNFLYITVLPPIFPLYHRVLLSKLACVWCFVRSGLMKMVEILFFDV